MKKFTEEEWQNFKSEFGAIKTQEDIYREECQADMKKISVILALTFGFILIQVIRFLF